MSSVQEDGVVKFMVETPYGNRYLLYSSHVKELGPGGSPDGVISSNQEKWRFVPADSTEIPAGSKVVILFKPSASDGIDVSDCTALIPFTTRSCLLYTSDAADEGLVVDLGGRRIIKKKKLIETLI